MLSLGLLLSPSASAASAPPGDDWSIERDDRQPALLEQRFEKLRSKPFDRKQWRALERSMGAAGLAKKIDSAAKRSPKDPGLAILKARSLIVRGEPRSAAQLLLTIRDRAGRWRSSVIGLEVDAWIGAGDVQRAIKVLEDTANGDSKPLLRAYELAERNQLHRDALRIAEALQRDDTDSALRIARAALAAGDLARADAAFAAAEKSAPDRQRPSIDHEWARAKLRSNDAPAAANLLWQAISATDTEPEREGLWSTLADTHRRDVSGTLSLDRLERWLAEPRHAKEAAAWRALASLEALEGRDPTSSWRRAVAADPRDREGLTALLSSVEASGDAASTAAEIRRLRAERSPETAPLALEIANRMIANGHRELGLGIAADVEAHAGRSTPTLIALLDFFNLNQEPDHALEIAQRMVKQHPRDPDARIALGEQLLNRGQVADALREWSAIPKLIRPRHRGWARHAELLAEHRHPDAILSLQKALAAAPNEPTYLRLRALLEQDSRVPQRALTSWQEILTHADKPEQRLLRDEARTRVVELLVSGTSGKTAKRRRDAEEDAKETLAKGSPEERVEAGLFLAELYSRQERHEEAVAIQEQLLELAPQDPERLAALARAQRRAGLGESAIATLERLVEVDPKRGSDVLTELAETALDPEDLERALRSATRAVNGGADSSRAIIRLGELYERRGETETAAATYQKALDLSPGNPHARLRLAKLAVAKGDTDTAAELFRLIIESDGPPEVTQEAGRGALDIAEASSNTLAVVELALLRAQREPANEEPRELLLDALDRSDPSSLKAWLADGEAATRGSALNRVLVFSLNRDAIGTRLRAAEHLGQLRLPGSAVPLARMGAQLAPPRDAPRPVKEAYAQARASALIAAGTLQDPAALPLYHRVIANRVVPQDVRYAAAWAALSTPSSRDVLQPFLELDNEDPLSTLVCVAVVQDPSLAHSPEIRRRLTLWMERSRSEPHRRACTMALAAITPDSDLAMISQLLDASDHHRAAIAAWRLGKVSTPTDAIIEALFRRYLGPKGIARDAAAASLARLVGARDTRPPRPLPQLRRQGWEMSVTRWLTEEATPAYQPLRAEDLSPWGRPLKAAFSAATSGTRAEREASREASTGCEDAPRAALCLDPLVHGPIVLDDLEKDVPPPRSKRRKKTPNSQKAQVPLG